MRVLLFVQTGDGLPKCVGRGAPHDRDRLALQIKAWDGHTYEEMRRANNRAFAECATADRWWLVECENAEAGRLIILRSEMKHGPDDWSRALEEHEPTPPGRILASGGRG